MHVAPAIPETLCPSAGGLKTIGAAGVSVEVVNRMNGLAGRAVLRKQRAGGDLPRFRMSHSG